ncbi:MAG: hypothetical protein LBF67_08115 [Prevotellaceae bacterium]|nr:hypothetical protein [Prevotellaceae bacterium]
MVAPNQARAGESFVVELFITNQNTRGFARFHVDLPKGFEPEQIASENAGADFSFIDRRVRFIWANLPETPEIKFSYRIHITDPRLKGTLPLLGRFTYVVGQDRQTADAEASVAIIPSPQVAAEQAIDIEAYQAENVQPWTGSLRPRLQQGNDLQGGEALGISTGEYSSAAAADTAGIFAVRQKPYMVDKEYYINIQITKSSISGSGRVDEKLSTSVSKIEAIETKGALFQSNGDKISFVWTEMPQDTGNFVIAYKVIPWQGSEQLSIQGTFTYNNGANETTVDIVEREVDFSVHVPVPPLATASQELEAPAAQRKARQTTQRGLVFKVQLLATQQPVQNFEDYFKQYNITDMVTEERYDSDARQYIYKYVVGPFRKYEQAQNYRNQVWRRGITDAFVTCYYNGDRITIQEALLISNKKR